MQEDNLIKGKNKTWVMNKDLHVHLALYNTACIDCIVTSFPSLLLHMIKDCTYDMYNML